MKVKNLIKSLENLDSKFEDIGLKNRLAIILSIVLLITLAGIYFLKDTTTYNVVSEVVEPKLTLEEKIAEVKKELIDTLSYECEVVGSEEPDGVIIFDVNENASIGKYQWQRESVKYYAEKLYGKTIKNDEAIAIAIGWHPEIDVDEFTLRVLFEEPDGYTNWQNCSNKFNLGREIEIIKKFADE